jgi:hypothetical protein
MGETRERESERERKKTQKKPAKRKEALWLKTFWDWKTK